LISRRHPERCERASKDGACGHASTDLGSSLVFEAPGDQVITGLTLTNVNDFRAILIRKTQAA
jgi:glycerate-2-kinase